MWATYGEELCIWANLVGKYTWLDEWKNLCLIFTRDILREFLLFVVKEGDLKFFKNKKIKSKQRGVRLFIN